MTEAEILLWSILKDKGFGGYKFRRQHSVGNYILDFYCPKKRLAIELDGSQHFTDDGLEYDEARNDFLVSVGIKVVRYSNREVFDNLNGVLYGIREILNS